MPLQVTMSGTRLTVVVGTNNNTGDITPIAYLGVAQTTAVPNFTISASPAGLSVVQGNQGSSTISTTSVVVSIVRSACRQRESRRARR